MIDTPHLFGFAPLTRAFSARDFQEALRELDPRVIVAVESTQLSLVVVPRHPDLDEIRARSPLPILAEFPRRVYHPILEDVDAAPVVVVFARPPQ